MSAQDDRSNYGPPQHEQRVPDERAFYGGHERTRPEESSRYMLTAHYRME